MIGHVLSHELVSLGLILEALVDSESKAMGRSHLNALSLLFLDDSLNVWFERS